MVGGSAEGEAEVRYLRPVPAYEPDPTGVAFAESQAYVQKAIESGVGALLVTPEMSYDRPCVRVAAPRVAFLALLTAYGERRPRSAVLAEAVSPDATVHPSAVLGPGCFVGPGCVIGESCWLGPNVSLIQDVRIGANCVIHAGAVLGADGFGYAWDGFEHRKVPQVGGVVLGDNVEIGANSCVDRATCGDTQIGTGTKIDNLVQIGHNVRIGRHVVIAGGTAVAGSVTIGDGAVIGGMTAIADHVTVCAGARIAGMTGVTKDVVQPGDYFGIPARPASEAMRQIVLVGRLPSLFERVDRLEAQSEDRND